MQRGTLAVTDGTFAANTADVAGGVLSSDSGVISLLRGNFRANTAPAGGAFSLHTQTAFAAASSSITDNTATSPGNGFGGAIEAAESTLSLAGVELARNRALAPALPAQLPPPSQLMGSDVAGGGAVFLSNSALSVSGGQVKGNSASHGAGGAIAAQGLSSVSIAGGTYSGNSAPKGGVIFAQSGGGSVLGSTFSGNTATLGSCLGLFDSSWKVNGTAFNSNAASAAGAVFFADKVCRC
jgi:predicted outer membrane repeat protein